MSAPLASEATQAAGCKVEEGPLAAAVKGTGPGRITRVSSDMYVAGQITEDQIAAIASHKGCLGSILNLRLEAEGTFLNTEEALCEALGVEYVHVPMHPSTITEAGMDKLLARIDTMAKPVLVHCASAMRAGAMAVAYETVRRQLDLDDLESMAARTPFAGTSNTAFKRLVRDYAAGRLAMIESLPDIVDISDDLFVGPTITEADMRALAKAGRMKTVINLRSEDEAGSLGLGMQAKERDVVESLGLSYVSIPTKANETPTDEEIEAVRLALESAAKPVFLHCRRMNRTAHVVEKLGLKPAVPKVAAAAVESE